MESFDLWGINKESVLGFQACHCLYAVEQSKGANFDKAINKNLIPLQGVIERARIKYFFNFFSQKY
jgi:hypothetical protein